MSVTDGLIVAAALAMLAALYAGLLPDDGRATAVVLWVDGAEQQRLPLDENRRVTVTGPLGETRIAIRDGRVRVLGSPGRRKLCVRAGWLTRAGERAVCLPNRVVVSVTGSTPRFDAINQ